MEETRDTKKKRGLAVTSSTAGGGVGLIDDLVVEILSRVPVKLICRFKCVSSSWRNLISHPENLKKLPQNLTGFFYFDDLHTRSFVSLAKPARRTADKDMSRPPSPCDFLPNNMRGGVVDCCNGLVLLNNSGSGSDSEPRASYSYVVCNPATEKWTIVPRSAHADKIFCASILCFDPAVSVHFHVVEVLDDYQDVDDCTRLIEWFNIYSSETGAWVLHPLKPEPGYRWLPIASRKIYFNGLLHFITVPSAGVVVALDMKGQTRRVIPAPQGVEVGLIGHSQGRLFYANRDARDATKLSIYVLGEGENGRWTSKHCIDIPGLFADVDTHSQPWWLKAITFHPHCDSVFLFDSPRKKLISYSMRSHRGHVIRSVTKAYSLPFRPYVPLYLEMAPLKNSN